MTFIKREPAVFWGLLTAVAEAVVGLLLVFDVVDWTTTQVGSVMLVIAAVGGMFAFIVRSQVTPTQRKDT